ncbi:MAG: PAS domain S-box protein [Gammaproteobacteria bacterium]
MDITEHRRPEQALRENEQILRRFFDAGLIGMAISSPDKGWIRLNDTYCEIMGYSREELTAMTWADLTHPDDMEEDSRQFKRILAGEMDGYTKEKRCIRKDGQVVHLMVSAKCVRKTDGTVDFFVVFVQDISERKRAEEEMRKSQAQLHQAQRIAHLGFWEWDIVNNNMLFSDELYSLCGITPEELGTTDFEVVQKRLFHPDDYDHVMKHIESAIHENAPFDLQHRIVRPDGNVRHIHVQGEVIRDERGSPLRLFGTVMDFTDYKRTVLELQRYEHIVNSTDEYMSYIDPGYVYRAVNQRYLDAFQKSQSEVVGHTVAEVTGAEYFKNNRQQKIARCLAGVSSNYQEWRFLPAYGERYLDYHYSPHQSEDGTVTGVVITARDITGQKQAQQELEEKNLRLRDAQRIGHLGFWDVDIRTGNTFWSDEIYFIFGVSQDTFSPTSDAIMTSIHADDRASMHSAIAASLDDNTPFDMEYRIVRPDGEVRYIHTQGEVVRDESGRPLRRFGTLIDVTDYRRAAQELQRYEHIVNTTDDLMVFLDPGYVYRAVNRRYLEAFGKSRDEVEGHHAAEILGEVFFEGEAKKNMDRCLGGEVFNFQRWHDFPGLGRRFMDINYTPYREADGRITGAVVSARDITGRKQAEEELSAYRQHLEGLVRERTEELESAQKELIRKERLAVLGQLTATVSHELRNPLGTINSSLYTIAKRAEEQGLDLGESVVRAERNVVRCSNIIEELLDYTRMHELTLAEAAIDDWLEGVLEEYPFPEGVVVTRELRTGVTLAFEKERLQRCVINLLNNACQAAMSPDGEAVTGTERALTVRTCVAGARLEIQVSDTGPGIPAEQREKIFEPLFSTKVYGVGLGLTIVRQVMQLHHGGIEIRTEEGGGTCVVVWLPLGPQEQRAVS